MSNNLARTARLLSVEIAEAGYTHIWYCKRVVPLLHQAQGSACAICGVSILVAAAALDHALSVASGGADDLTNFPVTCEPCNREKGDSAPAQHQFAVHRAVLNLLFAHGEGR